MLTFVFSCDSDESYEDLNRDPNNPTEVSADALFTSATKSLFDQMESTNVNINVYRLLAQYWTETTYVDESNYDFVTRHIPKNHWSEMYRDVLYDLQNAKILADTDTKKAMISVLEVYTWQQLVDTFGNIPYSEALQGAEIPSPAYDDAFVIYQDLIARLNTAITNLNPSHEAFNDIMYAGDVNQWVKFANSLKLKIAMRIADSNGTVAKTTAEEAVAAGVFTSNADNAILVYTEAVNANPLWADLVESGRSDFVATNTIVDYMNGLNDPRRPYYFAENLGAGIYLGGTYGDNNTFANYTHIGAVMHDPSFRGVLLDYSEIEFLLATAIEHTFAVGGDSATHYSNGITANMEDWGVSSADITTYLASPNVDYTTAPGTWREKIGTQFWLAMYNRGFEGWSVFRQYDAPNFNIPAVSGLPVPNRYPYPGAEQTLNETNYNAASTAIGGDFMSTKLFWDVN